MSDKNALTKEETKLKHGFYQGLKTLCGYSVIFYMLLICAVVAFLILMKADPNQIAQKSAMFALLFTVIFFAVTATQLWFLYKMHRKSLKYMKSEMHVVIKKYTEKGKYMIELENDEVIKIEHPLYKELEPWDCVEVLIGDHLKFVFKE